MKKIHFFLVLLCITLTGYRASAQCDSLIGTTQIMNGLPNGTYKVVVTGANGCTAEAYREVSTYNDLYVTIYNNQDNSCNTTNAGQLEAYVSSGTGPYTYQWSNGQTTSTISNLANGTYTVTVTGTNSCSATASRTISTYNDLYVTVYNNADNSCNTTNAGQLEAYVGNGTAPYSYQWSNGQNTAIINNLTNGTYTVTVTAANSCTATASRSINTYNDLYVTVYNNADNSCNTTNAGQLEAYVGNGTAPYSYQWSNGQNTAIINNLTNGTYTVTVTGANTCTATASRDISTYNDLYVTVYNNNDNSCNTTNAGQLEAYVGNGTAPYSYQWSNGQNTAIINNLTNGTYIVTVTGANTCTATASRDISTYNDLYVTVYNNADNSCNTTNAGQLEAYVGNGTAPYSYQWSNGQNTAIINNLPNGTYTVTVTGANTCTATASRDISTYNDLYVTVYNNNDNSCNTTHAGQLEAYVGNGTAPYTYQWYLVQGVTQPEITANNYTLTSTPGVGYQWYLNGQPINNANSQTYTAVTSGNYSVRVTYANGCSATSIVTVITVISGIDDINAATLKLYPNPATDVLTIEGLPGNIATLLQVYDLAGKLLLQQSETNHINVGQLAAGTYILHAGYQTQKKQLRFVKQ
ncbi:MAG TPA: T9SS type A sorting domain-containing protein [Chitinophagales bacterium]|nr:T9SS type A sorting domain-containing protein [Chitinophagales bacterium]